MQREAEILKESRIKLGMSQMDVAMNAGILLQQYQKFEYGDRQLSNSSMILGLRICAVLEIDPYKLVFENSTGWIEKVQ